MKKTKKEIVKKARLEPRKHEDFDYVLGKDIVKFHGKEWNKKFSKAFGIGTCPVVGEDKNGKPIIGIYYWDYERFADVVDYNKSTYWD